MRSPVLIFALVVVSCSSSKKLVSISEVTGTYQDYFGSKLTMNEDSTFNYSNHVCLSYSWTNGTWELKEDSLFLRPVFVYDTLQIDNETSEIPSLNAKSELFVHHPDSDFTFIDLLQFSPHLTHNQNLQPPPSILIYRKERLYQFDKEGKLMTKKLRGLANRKKWPPYYFRIEEE